MKKQQRLITWAAVALALLGAAAHAQSPDWGRTRPLPQRPGLYWENCGGCHESAGRFAPARLALVDGSLRLKGSGVPLSAFLGKHPVRLADDDLRALLETLATIVSNGAEFHARCTVCHGQVEQFARANLVLQNGILVGRYSGREIAPFLNSHARLDADGGAFFLTVLKRFAARE